MDPSRGRRNRRRQKKVLFFRRLKSFSLGDPREEGQEPLGNRSVKKVSPVKTHGTQPGDGLERAEEGKEGIPVVRDEHFIKIWVALEHGFTARRHETGNVIPGIVLAERAKRGCREKYISDP